MTRSDACSYVGDTFDGRYRHVARGGDGGRLLRSTEKIARANYVGDTTMFDDSDLSSERNDRTSATRDRRPIDELPKCVERKEIRIRRRRIGLRNGLGLNMMSLLGWCGLILLYMIRNLDRRFITRIVLIT